jgi:hypothetical protein
MRIPQPVEQIASLGNKALFSKLPSCALTDKNRVSQIGRHFLDAQCNCHGFAEHGMRAAMGRTYRTDQHWSLFNADTKSQRFQPGRGMLR